MTMNHESCSPDKILVMATKLLLILVILVLFYLNEVDIHAQNNNVYDTNSNEQIGDKKSYVIKYSLDGGFTGAHNFIWYNSTSNHLISNYKSNASLYDLRQSEALFDLQLSHDQQKNLSKLISDGNFFNISFNNNQPDCCDIAYFGLEIVMDNKMNYVSWTSGNIWEDANYERLPPIVINIVDTLHRYTVDSTMLFSESKIKDKFEIKREIIYDADLLLAEKNYTQAHLLYDKALEIDSTDVDALVNKAYSLIGLNQLENASLLIDKALNIQGDIYTLIAKATILIELGQGQEALGWIDRALELDPNNAKALEMKQKSQILSNSDLNDISCRCK